MPEGGGARSFAIRSLQSMKRVELQWHLWWDVKQLLIESMRGKPLVRVGLRPTH